MQKIVCFNGIGVAKWVWKPFEEYFSKQFKIITWDYPGHGSSKLKKDSRQARFEDLVKEGVKLIDRLKIKDAIFVGHSEGLHVALEVFRKRPKAAKALISCLGTPGHSLERFMDSFVGHILFDVAYIVNAMLPEGAEWLNKNLLINPVTYQIGAAFRLVNPAVGAIGDIERYMKNITSMNLDYFYNLVASASRHSSEEVLEELKLPTLFIASEFDRFVPLHIAQDMHRTVKGSKIFVIKNGTHAALLEQPDIFNLVIEKFISQRTRT